MIIKYLTCREQNIRCIRKSHHVFCITRDRVLKLIRTIWKSRRRCSRGGRKRHRLRRHRRRSEGPSSRLHGWRKHRRPWRRAQMRNRAHSSNAIWRYRRMQRRWKYLIRLYGGRPESRGSRRAKLGVGPARLGGLGSGGGDSDGKPGWEIRVLVSHFNSSYVNSSQSLTIKILEDLPACLHE